jgi:hypothetical protein
LLSSSTPVPKPSSGIVEEQALRKDLFGGFKGVKVPKCLGIRRRRCWEALKAHGVETSP